MKNLESTFIPSRAIDIQGLVGNIGGYVGLLLGYSILQIPEMIVVIARQLKRWYIERHSRVETIHIDHTLNIHERRLNMDNGSKQMEKDLNSSIASNSFEIGDQNIELPMAENGNEVYDMIRNIHDEIQYLKIAIDKIESNKNKTNQTTKERVLRTRSIKASKNAFS